MIENNAGMSCLIAVFADMYFELIRDAAGQTNQPYDWSIREI
jgi:hypothetical protein